MPLAASSTTRRPVMADGSTNVRQRSTKRRSRSGSSLRVPGVAAGAGSPAIARRPTSPMPVSPERGRAPADTIFTPVYCGGLWLAVMTAPAS